MSLESSILEIVHLKDLLKDLSQYRIHVKKLLILEKKLKKAKLYSRKTSEILLGN